MTENRRPPRGEVAIALHYDGRHAPRVTAQGQGLIADQILALAHQHDIPIHVDAGLAQVLSQVKLGTEIPETLYVAVARVIAFAYALTGKSPGDPVSSPLPTPPLGAGVAAAASAT